MPDISCSRDVLLITDILLVHEDFPPREWVGHGLRDTRCRIEGHATAVQGHIQLNINLTASLSKVQGNFLVTPSKHEGRVFTWKKDLPLMNVGPTKDILSDFEYYRFVNRTQKTTILTRTSTDYLLLHDLKTSKDITLRITSLTVSTK